jgi:predicted regulator of Ras-like GTPase activity (Roadblock/LC7/MglB family)
MDPTDEPGFPADEETAGTVNADRELIPGISERKGPDALDPALLERLKELPGVLVVSAFFEGFAVQSIGEADFDQVAALAEDLLRAGMKVASNMRIGLFDQLLLETTAGKFIIAPYGDLYLCVFTRANANLGLIRIALRSMQDALQ